MKPSRLAFGLTVLGTVALCSCAVGPNFKRPDAPKVTSFTAEGLTAQTGTDAQKYVPGQDIPAQWWTLFHSRPLDELDRKSVV